MAADAAIRDTTPSGARPFSFESGRAPLGFFLIVPIMEELFRWLCGLFAVGISSVVGYLIKQISELRTKLDECNKKHQAAEVELAIFRAFRERIDNEKCDVHQCPLSHGASPLIETIKSQHELDQKEKPNGRTSGS